jgi:nucleotide-binding universal stress UspA family protein
LTFHLTLAQMKNILIALDFEAQSRKILAQAESLAQAFEAKIWLVHIVAPNPDFVGYEAGPQVVREQLADELRQEHRDLETLVHEITERGFDAEGRLIQGPTVDTLLQTANQTNADLIVIGAHRHGWLYKMVIGSTTDALIDRASRPVLVVPVDQD